MQLLCKLSIDGNESTSDSVDDTGAFLLGKDSMRGVSGSAQRIIILQKKEKKKNESMDLIMAGSHIDGDGKYLSGIGAKKHGRV